LSCMCRGHRYVSSWPTYPQNRANVSRYIIVIYIIVIYIIVITISLSNMHIIVKIHVIVIIISI
jgi:hypothetical protein